MKAQITNHDYEQLSAYMDGQLAAAEQRKLESRLHEHPELQVALDELTRTRTLLRTAPRRRAPRNFTLTPAMVGSMPPRRSRTFLNLFPTLSFASALAAFALVISFAFQLLPGNQATNMLAAQPQAETAFDSSREMKAQSDAQPAAPSIAMESAPVEEQPAAGVQPEIERAAEENAAGTNSANVPPTIIWGSPNNAPSAAYGMGGGGGGSGDATGSLLGPPDIAAVPYDIPAPAEKAAPAEGAAPETTAPEAATEDTAPRAAQPNPSITGTGPILGVPTPEVAGQVIEQKLIQGQAAEEAAVESVVVDSAQTSQSAGLPRLVVIQVLLGLVAIVTGTAAFFVRRARSR